MQPANRTQDSTAVAQSSIVKNLCVRTDAVSCGIYQQVVWMRVSDGTYSEAELIDSVASDADSQDSIREDPTDEELRSE